MRNKNKAQKEPSPTRFSAQISLRVPAALLSEKNADLIPIYHLIQGLALRQGYCSAGDEYLSGELSTKDKEVAARTVRRKINRLEALGLVYRENPNQNRRLFPWHKYADKIESLGEGSLAASITAKALGKVLAAQGSLDFTPPKERTRPSDEMVGELIRSKYPADSFFELDQEAQAQAVSSFVADSVVDLCWLFETNLSAQIWDNWRSLTQEDRRAVGIHAPRLVLARVAEGGRRYIPRLSNYLDPRGRAWLDPLPAPAQARPGNRKAQGVSASAVGAAAEDLLSDYLNQ